MAIALQPKFPIPDRTSQPVRSMKDEDGMIDIGWCEGVLSDGRAFRAELWAQDQVSSLTLFFSAIGLETLEQDAMKHFVEKEGLVTFKKSGPTYCQALLFRDDGGNQVWSVNIVVGDEDGTFNRQLYSDLSLFKGRRAKHDFQSSSDQDGVSNLGTQPEGRVSSSQASAARRRLKHKQFYCVIDWPYWYNMLITRTTIAMMAM